VNNPTAAYRRALRRAKLPAFANRAAGGPFVVALEGPNGAGKSTLCAALARELGACSCLGTDPAWFAEPFKTRMIRDADWPASAMFFLSGCFEQMRLLRRCLEPIAVMDRSLWSTLAVQAAHDSRRLEALAALLAPVAAEVRIPNLTLVLEASLATCRGRIAQKSGIARALDELTANARFHLREREFYHWLAGQVPGVVFLPADEPGPEALAARAVALVRELSPC
jgi:thymidylate kinase